MRLVLPFRLKKREHPAPADALYLPGHSVAELLTVCTVLAEAWPTIHRLPNGFLILAREPIPCPIARTIHLRRLAGDLYLPADANLIPSLRNDEAVAFSHNIGWVLLPGEHQFSFDPRLCLKEAELFDLPPITRDTWEPVSSPPSLADRLHNTRCTTPPSVTAILQAGEPDEASPLDPNSTGPLAEKHRPPNGSFSDRVRANAALATGQMLNWLGRNIGFGGLAKAGANLARQAIERVPRLSERVLGDQEAALRALLKQFQAGDIEKALKRAPIAVADPNAKPGTIDSGSRLSEHNTRYSLRNLLSSGSGGVSAWLGGGDIWALLAMEYRRLAEEAEKRGDVRRAAYIHGVLLRDPRSAARALDTGGLHRDAAILYRDKVHDLPLAAGCFVRAGMWDEAVELFQQLGEYEKAGDLYRQIGEEDAAQAMYTVAADRLVANHQYLLAGNLMLQRAGQLTRAFEIYQQGWEHHGADTLGCGSRLLELYVQSESWPVLRAFVEDGAKRFAHPQTENAGRFFAIVMRQTQQPSFPADVRADLEDCSRLALADHLREHARINKLPGAVVSQTFGTSGVWPAPIVRDAQAALRHATTTPTVEPPPLHNTFALIPGPIRAAVVSRRSGALVVANEAGDVVVWHGTVDGAVQIIGRCEQPVLALAVDAACSQVVALCAEGDGYRLESFERTTDTNWQPRGVRILHNIVNGPPYLEPHIDDQGITVLQTHAEWRSYLGVTLASEMTAPNNGGDSPPVMVVRVRNHVWKWQDGVLSFCRLGSPSSSLSRNQQHAWVPADADVSLSSQPAAVPGSMFTFPVIDELHPKPDVLEFVYVDSLAAVRWCEATWNGDQLRLNQAVSYSPRGYRVAVFLAPALVAAIDGGNTLHWLKVEKDRLVPAFPSRRLAHTANAVFLAHRPQSHEVVVLFDDGTVMRVTKP